MMAEISETAAQEKQVNYKFLMHVTNAIVVT